MKIWIHSPTKVWYKYFKPVWLNRISYKPEEQKIYRWLFWGFTLNLFEIKPYDRKDYTNFKEWFLEFQRYLLKIVTLEYVHKNANNINDFKYYFQNHYSPRQAVLDFLSEKVIQPNERN
jgi:hypothetical protein